MTTSYDSSACPIRAARAHHRGAIEVILELHRDVLCGPHRYAGALLPGDIDATLLAYRYGARVEDARIAQLAIRKAGVTFGDLCTAEGVQRSAHALAEIRTGS